MKTRRIAAALTASLGFVLMTPVVALADDGFGIRQPERHVYDTAAVLTSDEVASLEQEAATLDKAGAPTIIYLRVRAANTTTTQQDGRSLMDAWRVESSPGAKDGLVVLLNLKPGDIFSARHLEAVIKELLVHYHQARPHQGLEQRCPEPLVLAPVRLPVGR